MNSRFASFFYCTLLKARSVPLRSIFGSHKKHLSLLFCCLGLLECPGKLYQRYLALLFSFEPLLLKVILYPWQDNQKCITSVLIKTPKKLRNQPNFGPR